MPSIVLDILERTSDEKQAHVYKKKIILGLYYMRTHIDKRAWSHTEVMKNVWYIKGSKSCYLP